jgi:hypothetical protein
VHRYASDLTCKSQEPPKSNKNKQGHTHKRTHAHTYIYIDSTLAGNTTASNLIHRLVLNPPEPTRLIISTFLESTLACSHLAALNNPSVSISAAASKEYSAGMCKVELRTELPSSVKPLSTGMLFPAVAVVFAFFAGAAWTAAAAAAPPAFPGIAGVW